MDYVLHFTHVDLDAVGCKMVVDSLLDKDTEILTIFCSNKSVDDIITNTIDVLKGNEAKENPKFYRSHTGEYTYITPDILNDIKYIFITDIGINEITADLLENTFPNLLEENRLLGFDHHKSNTLERSWFTIVSDKIVPSKWFSHSSYFANKRGEFPKIAVSGTYLVMDYFKHNEELNNKLYTYDIEYNNVKKIKIIKYDAFVDMLIQISLYDTWEWKRWADPDNVDTYEYLNMFYADTLASLISLIGIRNYVSTTHKTLMNILEVTNDPILISEKIEDHIISIQDIITGIEEKAVSHLLSNMHIQDNVGYYIVEESCNISMLFDRACSLYEEVNNLNYVEFIFPRSKNLSFRTTRDDMDVSDIAARYGGGGHKKAAGASVGFNNIIIALETYHTSESLEDYILNERNKKDEKI